MLNKGRDTAVTKASFGYILGLGTTRSQSESLESNPIKICIFKIIKNCCYTTTMDSMEAALADLSFQDKPNIPATADKHKVKRSTLSRRWNKVTRSREDGYDLMRFLSSI